MTSDDRMERRAQPRHDDAGPAKPASARFCPREHILKSSEFRNIYKKASPARQKDAVLYALPNGLEHNRIGFSISSRNVRRAVRRNRVRRLFREAYRLNRSKLKTGLDLVIVVKKDPGPAISYRVMEPVFLKLASIAGILI
jgi:ribonuclease P protein component